MLPTTAFAAPLTPAGPAVSTAVESPIAPGDGFVGWTIPSPCGVGKYAAPVGRPPSSLYTFPPVKEGLARDYHVIKT